MELLHRNFLKDMFVLSQGPIMNSARLAEKAVALVCCEKLHKIGKIIIETKIYDHLNKKKITWSPGFPCIC